MILKADLSFLSVNCPFLTHTHSYTNFYLVSGGSGIFQRLLKHTRHGMERIVALSHLDPWCQLLITRHLKIHRTKPKSE